MKKLQNNFTTPEQSKRLLELGVPADSADCYYDKYRILPNLLFNGDTFQDLLDAYEPKDREEFLPCWSGGRLMEIVQICSPYKEITFDESDKIEQVIRVFQNVKESIDFSKLED